MGKLQLHNCVTNGPGRFTPTQYSTGQKLIDPVRFPHKPSVAQVKAPRLQPTGVHEITGQKDHVVFHEGLVQFHEKCFIYFGQVDALPGVATAPVQS